MKSLSKATLSDQLALYFVGGTVNCGSPESFSDLLSQAIKGGITAFQFREKGAGCMTGRAQLEIAKTAKQLCREYGVVFIVNDDLELMKELDADGLHVGQTDGDLTFIRQQTEGKILGVSVHTLAEAEDAVKCGADYIGVGPVFPTTTKPDAKEPVGLKIFDQLRKNDIQLPIVGIGGITKENAAYVIKAGADGTAIISAISQAENPYLSSQELHTAILQAKEESR